MNPIARYLDEVKWIADHLDQSAIQRTVNLLVDVRERGGRLGLEAQPR